jgi:hypothetical protein
MFVRHVNDCSLEWLVGTSVDLVDDHFGPRDLEFESFPAHGLDEDRELQLASTGDLDDFRRRRGADADRDVSENLAIESFLDLPGCDELSVPTRERRRVDSEGHPEHWFVDFEARERLWFGSIGDRIADLNLGEAGDNEEISGDAFFYVDSAEVLEPHELAQSALERRFLFI